MVNIRFKSYNVNININIFCSVPQSCALLVPTVILAVNRMDSVECPLVGIRLPCNPQICCLIWFQACSPSHYSNYVLLLSIMKNYISKILGFELINMRCGWHFSLVANRQMLFAVHVSHVLHYHDYSKIGFSGGFSHKKKTGRRVSHLPL